MKFLQGFFKKKDELSGYAYTNTRVRVMKAKLLQKQDYQKLMKMSVAEIARFLEETEYKKEIDFLAMKYSGANLVEAGLNKNMENTFRKICDFSIKSSEEQARLYLKRYDIWCIKTILRGKFAKATDDEILDNLIAAGNFSNSFFEKIVKNSKSVEEAIGQFRETEYFSILKKNSGNLSKLEDELDKHYFDKVFRLSEHELNEFVKFEINSLNALSYLRSKNSKIKFELLPHGDPVQKILPKTENPLEAEKELKKRLVLKGARMLNYFKRNIGPVLAYFVVKQNEIDNIRIIVRGKQVGLADNIIEEQLIFA